MSLINLYYYYYNTSYKLLCRTFWSIGYYECLCRIKLLLAIHAIGIEHILKFCYSSFWLSKLIILCVNDFSGIVLPSDADTWITHMNNGRVFREFDFGRWDHFARSGLLGISLRKNGGGVVAAQAIRYRRPLHMFMTYKVCVKKWNLKTPLNCS